MIKYTAENSVTFYKKRLKFKGLNSLFSAINDSLSRYLSEFSFAFEYPAAPEASDNGNPPAAAGTNLYVIIKNNHDTATAGMFNAQLYSSFAVPVYEYLIEGIENRLSENYLIACDLVTISDIKQINRIASRANAVLKSFFERRKTLLTEIHVKFLIEGKKISVQQEFNPLTIRLLDINRPDLLEFAYNNSPNLKKYSNFILEVIKNYD